MRPPVWDAPGAEEAWAVYLLDYLRAERPSMAACRDRVARIAAARGWRLPSARAFSRRLRRTVPLAVVRGMRS